MLRVLDGKHAEAGVRYRVTADIDTDTPAGRLMGSHIEFLNNAAEALSSARPLGDEGFLNVEITDTTGSTGMLIHVRAAANSAMRIDTEQEG